METKDIDKTSLSPWVPETDLKRLKVLGKALEELGESVSSLARCIIQGIEECEPVTGKPNKLWVEDEIADVLANYQAVCQQFDLDNMHIAERAELKYKRLITWRDSL